MSYRRHTQAYCYLTSWTRKFYVALMIFNKIAKESRFCSSSMSSMCPRVHWRYRAPNMEWIRHWDGCQQSQYRGRALRRRIVQEPLRAALSQTRKERSKHLFLYTIQMALGSWFEEFTNYTRPGKSLYWVFNVEAIQRKFKVKRLLGVSLAILLAHESSDIWRRQ